MGKHTVRSFALDGLSVRSDKLTSHHAQAAKALSKNVGLHVSVVVLARPDKSTGGFDRLCDHVVNKAVLVVDACLLKQLLVLPDVRMSEERRI